MFIDYYIWACTGFTENFKPSQSAFVTLITNPDSQSNERLDYFEEIACHKHHLSLLFYLST